MQIQCERIWLFETSVADPFFLGEKDGVTATMTEGNPRAIDFINIKTVYFKIDVIGKSGLTYSNEYGGEDSEILDSYGKSMQDYELQVNVPTSGQKRIEELTGKQFSLLAMRRDLSHFIIFAQFQADDFKIDNEVQQRLTLKTTKTNARIFDVASFNIETIIDEITEEDLNSGGFDYATDFQMD